MDKEDRRGGTPPPLKGYAYVLLGVDHIVLRSLWIAKKAGASYGPYMTTLSAYKNSHGGHFQDVRGIFKR